MNFILTYIYILLTTRPRFRPFQLYDYLFNIMNYFVSLLFCLKIRPTLLYKIGWAVFYTTCLFEWNRLRNYCIDLKKSFIIRILHYFWWTYVISNTRKSRNPRKNFDNVIQRVKKSTRKSLYGEHVEIIENKGKWCTTVV